MILINIYYQLKNAIQLFQIILILHLKLMVKELLKFLVLTMNME